MNKKKIYEQPDTAVTRVELESPICSGSFQIEAQAPEGINTQAQEVNSDFEKYNTYVGENDGWDVTGN